MSILADVLTAGHGRLLTTGLYRLAGRYGIPTEEDLVDFLTRGGRDPDLARKRGVCK